MLSHREFRMPTILSRLDSLPKSYYNTHMWADYLEMRCLLSVDRSLSKSEVLDQVRITAEDLSEGGINDDVEEDTENQTFDGEMEPAEVNDKWNVRVNDWFEHLSYRAGAFSTAYPFSLSATEDVLAVATTLTAEQNLYVFLLLCANLRYCKSSMPTLTRTFERLSADVLRSCLTDTAEVHIFGTSEIGTGRYTGSLWENINSLAKDLGETIHGHITESSLPKPNYDDGGLDIVAWVPLGDANSHRIVVFGQCACTLEWDLKQYTATGKKWRQIMPLSAGVSSIVFIPHSLRQTDGSWHDVTNIATIMMDRLRIMYLLKGKNQKFEASRSKEIVDQAVAQREDIF